jgi:hypothetical protein
LRTIVENMPKVAATLATQKLGHPVPESNFVVEEKRWFPQPAHTYMPLFLL